MITNINLSSLVILCLLKTVLYHVKNEKDPFIVSNCLSIISNLSPYIKNIHSFVAQKFFYFIHIICKKLKKSKIQEEVDNYLKFLQVSIEALNISFIYGLNQNKWLVYELLHQKEVLDNFKNLDLFKGTLVNIDIIISHFGSLLQENTIYTVDELIFKVEELIKSWNGDKLTILEHFKFTYSEDHNTELFVFMYIWKNVKQSDQSIIWKK